MRSTANSKSIRKKKWLIAVGVVLAAGTILFSLEKTGVTDLYSASGKSTDNQIEGGINYGPPTKEEQEAGDKQKEENIKREETISQNPQEGKQTVNVGSDEHTSELQSLMRKSYAVFCYTKKKNNKKTTREKYKKK